MFVIVFIDHSLINSLSVKEHISHLIIFLLILKDWQLFAKFSNCKFQLSSVAFLVHIIYREHIQVYCLNKKVVKNCPRQLPSQILRVFWIQSVTTNGLLKYFLIFLSFVQIDIEDFFFLNSKACSKSFQQLKTQLTLAILLTLKDGFVVCFDASKIDMAMSQ